MACWQASRAAKTKKKKKRKRERERERERWWEGRRRHTKKEHGRAYVHLDDLMSNLQAAVPVCGTAGSNVTDKLRINVKPK